MSKVLIVEDDPAISFALRDGFEFEGWTVVSSEDGAAALELARDRSLDLMILDVMLPNVSGLDVCRQLRGAGNDLPIIMLTARGQEIDRVLGLKLGADDYVTKPFSFTELMARAEALLRRVRNQVKPKTLHRAGNLSICFDEMTVARNGELLDLTAREFRLLQYFVEHRGKVVTRDQLLDAVWGYNSFPASRTVDMHIAKLRQKIEETPNQPRLLVTVHGSGYKFVG
jgi:two-component system alkaline phosphatase synthesis response regulator PhoP